jgi:DNA topoisomerase-1
MVIKAPKVKEILNDPIKAAETANLIYITDTKLTIKRHPHGRGFYYTRNGKKIEDKKSIDRFKSLVIPPAWTDVKITHLKNGHLQVVGRDEKNRKQYRYHPNWNELRKQTKFYKLVSFGNALPSIRKQIETDLRLKRMNKRKCLALVIRLMEETHIRIGSDYYAKRNKSYGLSTLRTKHLDVLENSIKFEFKGKKGKKHAVTLKNKKLQRLVLQCEEIPGWELFQYYDEEGNHHSIDSGMLNDYIQELSGELFSAKDFRTWGGSKVFFETLFDRGIADTQKERKQNIIEAYDITASALGNTRAVCKKYYVHPLLPELYESGKIGRYFKKLNKNPKSKNNLTDSERIMLEIITDFKVGIA